MVVEMYFKDNTCAALQEKVTGRTKPVHKPIFMQAAQSPLLHQHYADFDIIGTNSSCGITCMQDMTLHGAKTITCIKDMVLHGAINIVTHQIKVSTSLPPPLPHRGSAKIE